MSRRRRPAIDPVAVIVVLAAIPAMLLWSLWSWAGDKSDAADAAPPTSTTIVPPPAPLPALNTPLGSLRRASPALARDLNLEQFRAAVQPLLGAVNDRSCVALSVDGYDAGSANADAVVLPASTEKLVVAAVALEVLGETFTFTTRVVGPAPVGGVVTGDVYVVGGGDPVLSGDWYATSNLERYPGVQHDVVRRARRRTGRGRRRRASTGRCSATAPATTTSSSRPAGVPAWPGWRAGRTTR